MADVGLIQKAHPEWNIVQAIDAPDGGVWALGADGGVFSLDQAGNASTTTPFYGSYPTLPADARQGFRSFVAIQPDVATGGYQLVSQRGEVYKFAGPNTPVSTPGGPGGALPPPGAIGAPAPDASDSAWINGLLTKNGLGDLSTWAFARYRELGATPAAWETVQLEAEGQPAFQARFPGWDAAKRQGINTPGEYIAYETQALSLAAEAGLPADFVDRDDVAKLMAGNVSIHELGGRISLASQAAFNAPPEVTAALSAWGVDTSGLTAYYLNPDKALPFLERQQQAAQVSGTATRTGFGGLSESEATRLAQLGMTPGQAQGAFGQAVAERPLTEELIGETTDLTRDTQLGAIGGSAPDALALERRRTQRLATFAGGGGAAGTGKGTSGLGSAGS